MTTLLNALAQLLLPAECLVCHRLLGPQFADDLVCRVCRLRWRPVRRPWCERCGQPEPHFGPCRLCRAWPAELTAARSAVRSEEHTSELQSLRHLVCRLLL